MKYTFCVLLFAIWMIYGDLVAVNVYRCIFSVVAEEQGDPSSLWEGAASVVAESAGVTTQAL